MISKTTFGNFKYVISYSFYIEYWNNWNISNQNGLLYFCDISKRRGIQRFEIRKCVFNYIFQAKYLNYEDK